MSKDSVQVVFSTPLDAVAFAIAAERGPGELPTVGETQVVKQGELTCLSL